MSWQSNICSEQPLVSPDAAEERVVSPCASGKKSLAVSAVLQNLVLVPQMTLLRLNRGAALCFLAIC